MEATVYFIIRLLATSSDDAPIIIFQEKDSSQCYAYGGLTTLRSGVVGDFRDFLSLDETWYIVDSSKPLLTEARTIIAASANSLFSDTEFKEAEKLIEWQHYMAPWDLEELTNCRTKVKRFEVVPLEAVKELFSKLAVCRGTS